MKKEELKSIVMNVRKVFLFAFLSWIVATVLVVLFFETGIVSKGILQREDMASYILSVLFYLLSGAFLVCALRLFNTKKVRCSLLKNKEKAFKRWGIIRISMLGLPLFADMLLCYIFDNKSFFYLSLIVLLAMLFVVPSKRRCSKETELFLNN